MKLDIKSEEEKITFLKKLHTKNMYTSSIGSGSIAFLAIYGTLFEWIVTLKTFPNLDVTNILLVFMALNLTTTLTINNKLSKRVDRSLIDYLNAENRLLHMRRPKREQEEQY